MGDISMADLKKMIGDILDKVTGLEGKISSIKVDKGRLHVASNNVQSLHRDYAESSLAGSRDKSVADTTKASPTASHKLRFPKIDGSTDPIAWTHRWEQFFRAACTADDEKVWLASFYMDGAVQQWYFRLERN
jgi:hypothetical protein